jgi:serine phosphatase RsbU (regulator of sigma subunit)
LCFLASLPHIAFPQQDTVAVQEKIDKARSLFAENPALSLKVASEAYNLAKNAGNKRLVAYSFNTIGSAYNYLGENDSSVYFHQQALEIQKEIDDQLGMGRSLTNLGIAYTDQGLHDKAIDCFLQAEKKFSSIGFDVGLSKLYNSLGALFYTINDYNNSVRYYKKGIELSEKLDDPVLNYSLKINLANVYGSMGHGKDALPLYREGYAIAKADSNYSDLVMICNNVCHEYIDMGMFDSARIYSNEALSIIRRYELEKNIQLTAFSNQAAILSHEGRNREAVAYVDSALRMISSNTDLNKEIGLKHQLGLLLSKSGNLERSIEVLKEVLNLKDTLYKKNLEEKLSEINTVHEVEKKEEQIKSLNRSQEQQRLINYLLAGVAIVLIVFLLVAIRSYRRKKRDNTIIQRQKDEMSVKNAIIEQKHKEITDSINYAERIQRSFLATKELLDANLEDYFVFFQPKDVVSGDFYWAGKLSNGNFVLATADSTGHGVPGAIMSLLNITSIEGAIKDGFKEPAAILNETRKTIIDRLKKDGSIEGGKDGMDCSLCSYDFVNRKLHIAAANNPVWIVRGSEITEIKPDKMPVGKHDRQNIPFSQQEYNLQEGDVVYTLTDGFPDQFGGEKGKKFMSKKLRELLVTNAQLPMNEQKQLLEKIFEDWVGSFEQVDDVCIIGIRV